jgi:cytochrome c6
MRRSFSLAALFAAALCSAAVLAATSDGPRPESGAVAGLPSQSPDAATLFAKRCATCHGKDGRAKTFKAKFNKARDLTDSEWQAGVTDERLFNSITRGRGKMPPFGKKLTDAQAESLVAYVRGLKE